MQAAIIETGYDSGGPFARVGLFPDGVDPHALDQNRLPLNRPIGTPFVVRPDAADYAGTDALSAADRAKAVIAAMTRRGLEQAKAVAEAELHRQELADAAAATASQTFPL